MRFVFILIFFMFGFAVGYTFYLSFIVVPMPIVEPTPYTTASPNTGLETQREIIQELEKITKKVKEHDDAIKRLQDKAVSRGNERLYRVTMYDICMKCCGKTDGITASGRKVQIWHTIASGTEFKFGTKVYIPYFKNYPNSGIFAVEDRGSGVPNGAIDIYNLDAHKIDFTKYLDIYVVN